MTLKDAAPWHRESWDRFVNELLPDLLRERVPLVDYRMESTGDYTCGMEVIVEGAEGDVQLTFDDLPKSSAWASNCGNSSPNAWETLHRASTGMPIWPDRGCRSTIGFGSSTSGSGTRI